MADNISGAGLIQLSGRVCAKYEALASSSRIKNKQTETRNTLFQYFDCNYYKKTGAMPSGTNL